MQASYTLFWSSVLWTNHSLQEFNNTCLIHTSALVSLLASAHWCNFSDLCLMHHLRMCSKKLHLEMFQSALLLYSSQDEKCSNLTCSVKWQDHEMSLLLLFVDVLYQLRDEKCLSLTCSVRWQDCEMSLLLLSVNMLYRLQDKKYLSLMCSLNSQDHEMSSLLLSVETLFSLQDQLQIVSWLN